MSRQKSSAAGVIVVAIAFAFLACAVVGIVSAVLGMPPVTLP